MRISKLSKPASVVPLAGLFLIAVLSVVATFAGAGQAGAQSSEVVRLNTLSHGGFYAPLSVSEWTKWGQSFCTGGQEVTLKKLRLWTQAVSLPSDGMPTVSIHANQPNLADGLQGTIVQGVEPGHRVGTLTTPTLDGNISTAEDFTSSGIVLRPYSRYWVVLERPSNVGTFRLALANREGHSSVDDGGESGWELTGSWHRTQTYYYGVRRIPMDAWYYDGFYHNWSLSMGLYTTPDEKANSPPVLFAGECGSRRDPGTEFSVDENTPPWTVFARTRAFDGDGDTLTYTLTGRDRSKFNRLFSFNTSNGDIFVKSGARVNFEETVPEYAAPLAYHTYNLQVSVTDGKDDTGAVESDPTIDDSRSITIRVKNVDEAGRVKFEEFDQNDQATEITTPTVGTAFKATPVDPDDILRSLAFAATRFEFTMVPRVDENGDPEVNIDGVQFVDRVMTSIEAIGISAEGWYTPVTADVGKYLGVRVTYVDKECPYVYRPRDIDGDGIVDPLSRWGQGRLLRAFGDCTKYAFNYMENTVVAASSEQQESGTRQQRSINRGRSVPNGPTFSNTRKSVNVRVNENSGGNTPVAEFEATDPNNDPISFFVGGTDVNAFANAFDFDTSNGDIDVKSDDSLDYETKQRYSITVSVTDGKDSSGKAEDPPTMDDSVDVEISVVNVNDPGVVTLSPNPPVINRRVRATLTDDDGVFTSSNNAVVWRWLRSGTGDSDSFTEISGATSETYRPVQADLGRRLKARATYSDRLAQGRVATSEASYPVANPNQPAAGTPTISGTAEVGQTLTASTTGITDADGLDNVTFAYQWLADDVEIADATGSSYTVSTSDVDKTIKVRVSFRDDSNHSEELTSAATASVTPQTSTARQNSAAAGTPSISGTAQVGETLTAVTSGITDADGLTNATFAYQWLADDVEISNATGSSYIVTASDVGKTIKVRVSFTDDLGSAEVLTSAATGTVLARANRPAAGTPSISGTARVGETLTAVTSGISDADGLTGVSYSYQWLADDVDIANATSSSYTVITSDVGKTIKVRVSFTDDASNAETLTSAATGTVLARANRPASGSPSIGGTAHVGETLTAVTSAITDADGLTGVSYSYQWLANNVVIANATGSSYIVAASDVGKTIKVRVSFTDDLSNSEELTSGATATVPAQFTATILNAPTAHDGTNFTFELRFSEKPKRFFSYRTLRDHAFTVSGGDVHYVQRLERGKNVRWEITISPSSDGAVTISLPATTSCTATGAICTDDGRKLQAVPATEIPGPPPQNSPPAGGPTISGTAQIDETLTAVTSGITDADGLTGVSYNYQWLADDVEIANATGSSYTVTASDLNKAIKVRVSFTDDASNAEVLTSTATAAVSARANRPAAGSPTISGTARVGETLTAVTSGITDADGLVNVAYTYEWFAGTGQISGASSGTYTLTDAEKGFSIKVRVSFTDDSGNPEALTSAATSAVEGPLLTATIHNAPSSHDGSDFTFELRFSEHFGLSYKTLRDTAFTVTGAEVVNATRKVPGKNVRWEILVSPSSNGTVTIELPATTDCDVSGAICTSDDRKLSSALSIEVPGPGQQTTQTPQNTPAAGGPTISGTAQVGKTLTAVTSGITDADGLTGVSYSYQWLSDDVEITNATGSSYTVTDSELNKTIKVRVSFTDDASNAEVLTSAATGAVSARANSPAAGAPTISGTARVGETLTAVTSNITDADGLANVAYTYEWFAGTSQISGASGSTYLLTDSEKGSLITVRVSFTDDSGNPEALTSVATSAVAAPLLTATIHDAPASHNGSDFTFELRFSEHFPLSYRTLWDHAFTVSGGEVSHVRRLERGKNIRWEITVTPSSNGTVTIELPVTTDCTVPSAICAGDGRMLSSVLSTVVPGPNQ